MKKEFEDPIVSIVSFSVSDIINTSYGQGNFEGYAPDSDDSEFG